MASGLDGELLEPFYQGSENPAWSYERTPARPAPSELLALDRLTLAAVTTGMVDLPSGDRIHAGVWLRALRTLVDEMIRPSGLLRRGAYACIVGLWRAAGRGLHEGLGRLMPFEAMVPERRELALKMAGSAALSLVTGELAALKENGPVVLRSSPSTSGPDLESIPIPLLPAARDPVADAIATARADPPPGLPYPPLPASTRAPR